jgi:hypothetical protein
MCDITMVVIGMKKGNKPELLRVPHCIYIKEAPILRSWSELEGLFFC